MEEKKNNEARPVGISAFLEKLDAETQRQELSEEKRALLREKVDIIRVAIEETISEDGKEYLNSLSPRDVEGILVWKFRDILRGADNSKKYDTSLEKEGIQNIEMYLKVRGYENEDLNRRKESDPVPTAAEVLMGCYIEQIENHVRDAVRILRAKGYNTVESGFDPACYEEGGQFFHIITDQELILDEGMVKKIENEHAVSIFVEKRGLSQFVRFKNNTKEPKQLSAWGRCLTAFAEGAPTIGEAEFTKSGDAVDFAFHAVKAHEKDAITRTATTARQKELIEQLYKCKTEKEIEELIGIKEEDRRIHWNARKAEKG